MQSASVKVTYSLDSLTVAEIEEMAAAWDVPKSEVVRRAIHEAAARKDELDHRRMTPEEALECLQRKPRLSQARAQAWSREVAAERRATSRP